MLKIKEDSINEIIKKYDKLIELNQNDDYAYFKRAAAKDDLACFKYYNHYTYSLNEDRDKIVYAITIAEFYKDYEGDYKAALHDYSKVIKLNSKYADTAYYHRGIIRTRLRVQGADLGLKSHTMNL